MKIFTILFVLILSVEIRAVSCREVVLEDAFFGADVVAKVKILSKNGTNQNISFIVSTCDFSSSVNNGISNAFGQRPRCKEITNGLEFDITVGTTERIIELIVLANIEICGTYDHTNLSSIVGVTTANVLG